MFKREQRTAVLVDVVDELVGAGRPQAGRKPEPQYSEVTRALAITQ